MILDAEQREESWFRDFDICICGAGPAGITLARRLAAKGRRVALFEAGGFDPTTKSQELYRGDIVGIPYTPLDEARVRFFGGSSNHWTGYSRPIDEHDFEHVSYDRLSGWPIKRSDLEPYSHATAEILELPAKGRPTGVLSRGGFAISDNPYRMSPVNFGNRYRAELEKSDQIVVFLNSNLVDIELDKSLKFVTSAVFRSYLREDTFVVRHPCFVLCLGGIENPRFMLNANRQISKGLGNQHDVVGRHFAEHPGGILGKAIMDPKPAERLFYIASPSLTLERECQSFQVVIVPLDERPPGLKRYAEKLVCSTSLSERIAEAVLNRAPVCHNAEVGYHVAQSVNPDSRVLLTDQTDRFGLRKAVLDWRLTELDNHTIRVAALETGRWLAEQNIGRLQLTPWLRESNARPPATEIGHGFHHMCTTRMSDDPKLGVVDRNCKVHGIDNLFIGGSSVFSTPALSNPTFTIVQLALRLGDYLSTQFGLMTGSSEKKF